MTIIRFENPLIQSEMVKFSVTKIEPFVSKAGNSGASVQLYIEDPKSGKAARIRTILIAQMPHILKHFCEAIGKPELYKKDETSLNTDELIGAKGYLILGIRHNDYNDIDENYVRDFISKDKAPADIIDDKIPF